MTTRTLSAEIGRRSAWLRGSGITDVLRAAHITRRQWDHDRRCWMVPVDQADDALAAAEHRGYRVEVTPVDR